MIGKHSKQKSAELFYKFSEQVHCYIRQVNGVKLAEIMLSLLCVRPSVHTQFSQAEARFELGTFRMWGECDNQYTMETYCIMAFTSS